MKPYIAVVTLPNPRPVAGEAYTECYAPIGEFPTREEAEAACDIYAARHPVIKRHISQTLPPFFFRGASPDGLAAILIEAEEAAE